MKEKNIKNFIILNKINSKKKRRKFVYWEARSATPAKCLIEKEIKRAQKNKIFFNFN